MKIIKTGATECFDDLPIEINWAPTSKCNYRCSYCFIYGKGKTPPPQLPFSTLDQLKIAVDNIASLNRPFYNVVFSGGEPTIHPHIFDLVSMLYDSLGQRLNHILIITNGSRNKNLYDKVADISKSVSISLNISIHTDHVEIPHILELIENLSSNVIMNFTIMFNPDKRELVRDIYETMLEYRKKFYFNIGVAMIRDGDRVDPRYIPKDFEWQKEFNERITALLKSVNVLPTQRKASYRPFNIFTDVNDNGEQKTLKKVNYSFKYTNGLINFKGMHCMAYASLLHISSDGSFNGMVCSDDRAIGNIFEKNSIMKFREKLIRPIRCTRAICGCSSNYIIPKFASEEEAKKYVAFAQKRQSQLFAEYELAQNKKQSAPPTAHEYYDPNLYKAYLNSIKNPLADISLDSLRNSFPVVI